MCRVPWPPPPSRRSHEDRCFCRSPAGQEVIPPLPERSTQRPHVFLDVEGNKKTQGVNAQPAAKVPVLSPHTLRLLLVWLRPAGLGLSQSPLPRTGASCNSPAPPHPLWAAMGRPATGRLILGLFPLWRSASAHPLPSCRPPPPQAAWSWSCLMTWHPWRSPTSATAAPVRSCTWGSCGRHVGQLQLGSSGGNARALHHAFFSGATCAHRPALPCPALAACTPPQAHAPSCRAQSPATCRGRQRFVQGDGNPPASEGHGGGRRAVPQVCGGGGGRGGGGGDRHRHPAPAATRGGGRQRASLAPAPRPTLPAATGKVPMCRRTLGGTSWPSACPPAATGKVST